MDQGGIDTRENYFMIIIFMIILRNNLAVLKS